MMDDECTQLVRKKNYGSRIPYLGQMIENNLQSTLNILKRFCYGQKIT
uniref:Uncharacterized protein n=1 Tax=Arundo donax TaxID=35708 RepID=A0A0A8XXB9_ARUDO